MRDTRTDNGRSWMRRVATAFRRHLRYRITRSGYLFASALVLVGAAAIASANNLLFLILAAMLATLLISGVVSRLGLAGLHLELVLPEHISARQPVPVRLRMRNLKWFSSFAIKLTGLDRDIAFPMLPGLTTVDADVSVTFPRRGVHRENLFVIATRFPFGFVERRAPVSITGETVIYPALEGSAMAQELLAELRGELEGEQRGLGADFYRLRPYEYQESARHVDWKSSAHTGELQVREFAREERSTIYVFFDLSFTDDHAAFEKAVECCAFLVWSLSNDSARIRFRTQTTDLMFPEQAGIYAILRVLALASPIRKPAVPEPDEDDPQVLFTASPGSFADLGWQAARVVTPENL